MTNPLLDFTDLPLFDQIRPEHVAPAVDALARRGRRRAAKPSPRRTFPADWNAISQVLDVASERSRAPGARWAT